MATAATVLCTAGCSNYATYTPVGNPTPTPNPTPTGNGTPAPGGAIDIIVPAAPAVVCTPSPVTVPVNQRTVISCTAPGYSGPFTWSVNNPQIANVQLAAGTYTLFYVTGLQAGTTSLSLQYGAGGTGGVMITVTP